MSSNGQITGVGGGGAGFESEHWWVGRANGPGSSMEDPHPVFGGVPELLRLANSGSHAQLQEGATTRTYNTAPQLYRRREEELQRDELGSHT